MEKNMPEKTGAIEQFFEKCQREVADQGQDAEFAKLSLQWLQKSVLHKYSYHFTWLGRPIIQYPQDIMAMQELIWEIKPDLILETGIAHGGSLIFYASLLELNALCGGPDKAKVLGVDIEIRRHNRKAITEHPLYELGRIKMVEGSSVDKATIAKVRNYARDYSSILVLLDSNHTYEHVLKELEAYAPLVTPGSYCVVFDTMVEKIPDEMYSDRPWGQGNNPATAVREFLKAHPEFISDTDIDNKLGISVAPHGFLQRKGDNPSPLKIERAKI